MEALSELRWEFICGPVFLFRAKMEIYVAIAIRIL